MPDAGPITWHGNICCPADWQVTEPHGPGYSRIYHVTGGGAHYRAAGCSIALTPGHLYLFPENTPYQMRHDPADPLCCLYLHASLFPLVLRGAEVLPVEPGSFLAHLLAAMAAEMRGNDNLAVLQSLLNALSNWLAENIDLPAPRPEILKAVRHIQENCRRPLAIAELSRLAGWQDQYFIRLFKQDMGITPHQYLLRFRLHQAALMLLQGASVTEAALESGFDDLKPFSKAFRSKYQIAPSRYRDFYQHMP